MKRDKNCIKGVRVKVQLHFPWQQGLVKLLLNFFSCHFPGVTLRKGGPWIHWVLQCMSWGSSVVLFGEGC